MHKMSSGITTDNNIPKDVSQEVPSYQPSIAAPVASREENVGFDFHGNSSADPSPTGGQRTASSRERGTEGEGGTGRENPFTKFYRQATDVVSRITHVVLDKHASEKEGEGGESVIPEEDPKIEKRDSVKKAEERANARLKELEQEVEELAFEERKKEAARKEKSKEKEILSAVVRAEKRFAKLKSDQSLEKLRAEKRFAHLNPDQSLEKFQKQKVAEQKAASASSNSDSLKNARYGRRATAPIPDSKPLNDIRATRRATSCLEYFVDSKEEESRDKKRAAELVVLHVPRFIELSLDPVGDMRVMNMSGDCEWNNKMFYVSNKRHPDGRKIVARKAGEGFGVNLGDRDLQKFLDRKKLCEIAASEVGLGPKLHALDSNQWFLSEHLTGGILRPSDLYDETTYAIPDLHDDLGYLVARVHQIPNLFRKKDYSDITDKTKIWKATNFMPQHCFDICPDSAWVELRKHGVNKKDVRLVLNNLAVNPIFEANQMDQLTKRQNHMYKVVTLHNDIQPENLIFDEDKSLKLVEYDWMYHGYAGAEFGTMALLCFGYLPAPKGIDGEILEDYWSTIITPLPLQRKFASSYITLMNGGTPPTAYEVELFLFDMQKWTYWAFVRMGLYGAVLGHYPWCPDTLKNGLTAERSQERSSIKAF